MKRILLSTVFFVALLSIGHTATAGPALNAALHAQWTAQRYQAIIQATRLDQILHHQNPLYYNPNALQSSDPSTAALVWKAQARLHQTEAHLLRARGW